MIFIKHIFYLYILFFCLCYIFSGCDYIEKNFEKKNELYFCERYDKEKGEINRRDTFQIGNVFLMIYLSKPFGDNEIYVHRSEINSGKILEPLKFSVYPDAKYAYFPDIPFNEKGSYKVECKTKEGEIIVSGNVNIK